MKIDQYLRNAASTTPVVVAQAGGLTGLGILRDLAEFDIPTLALDSDPAAVGLRSTLAPSMVSPDPADDEPALLAFLERLGRRLPQRAVVFPADERYLETLARHADALAPWFILPYSRWPVLRRLTEQPAWTEAVAKAGLVAAGAGGAGRDDELWTLGSYLDAQSRPLALFTGCLLPRRRGARPRGVAAGRWDQDVADAGLRLLAALGYHGVSQVELTRSGAGGEFGLVAFRAGHWPWHSLAAASGVNLSLAAYRDAIGHPYVARRQTDGRKWLVAAGVVSLRDPVPGLLTAGRRVRSLLSRTPAEPAG